MKHTITPGECKLGRCLDEFYKWAAAMISLCSTTSERATDVKMEMLTAIDNVAHRGTI
jgi:hypothetical protein